MTREEFDLILERYVHDHCNDEERKYVERWLLAAQQSELGNLGPSQLPDLRDRLWEAVDSRLIQLPKDKAGSIPWRLAKVAASVSLIAVSGFLVYQFSMKTPGPSSEYRRAASSVELIRQANTALAVKRVALTDGSFIYLEPGSEVTYPVAFNEKREVHLTGEAFFKVKRDEQHPFLVYTSDVTTKVLGTSFRVTAYKNQEQIRVVVKTGKVSVISKGRQRNKRTEVVLTPNQEVVYHKIDSRVSRKLVDTPEIVDRQLLREMHYVNSPVVEIFEALEKAYGIDIVFNKSLMSGCTITTDLSDEGLYERLDIICHALGATYRIGEASIAIDAKRCN